MLLVEYILLYLPPLGCLLVAPNFVIPLKVPMPFSCYQEAD